MKFFEHHRTDILACFDNYDFNQNSFSFRKKKGRIIIELNESDTWFSYFKKEDFFMNTDTLEKIDISHYEVKTSDKELIKVNQWKDVLQSLNEWLSGINSKF